MDAESSNHPARQNWIEVDKTAIAHNVHRIKEIIGPNVALMAIVKANGYGHGAVAAGSTALLNGATYLGVASVSEAIELRNAAIHAPILILTYTPSGAAADVIRYNLTIALYDLEVARQFDRAAREMNATIKVHIKIDTGMSRFGLLPDQVIPFFRGVQDFHNLIVEGIFTHFSSAESNAAYTREQLRAYHEVLKSIQAAGLKLKYIHAANTAGTLNFPEARFNMVRCGIGLYGLNPGSDTPLPSDFRPALSWKTEIAQVKMLPPGTFVGCGNTYQTRGEEQIAVIPVGYADGFRHAPKTWREVLVGGQRAPIVGRVSMNLSTIDMTNIPGVSIGDEVVLIGGQGDQRITADDVAKQLGTINYEVVTTIGARVPRV